MTTPGITGITQTIMTDNDNDHDRDEGIDKSLRKLEDKTVTSHSEDNVLHISNLTRNVKESHLREIFGYYGDVKSVDLEVDKKVGLSRGFAYIKFSSSSEAEEAAANMDDGQIDGQKIKVSFVLVQKKTQTEKIETDENKKDIRGGRDNKPVARGPPVRNANNRRSRSPYRANRSNYGPRRDDSRDRRPAPRRSPSPPRRYAGPAGRYNRSRSPVRRDSRRSLDRPRGREVDRDRKVSTGKVNSNRSVSRSRDRRRRYSRSRSISSESSFSSRSSDSRSSRSSSYSSSRSSSGRSRSVSRSRSKSPKNDKDNGETVVTIEENEKL